LANLGVATDAMGNAIIFYAGDTQGNLWKFDFQSGVNAENACDKTKPLAFEMPPASSAGHHGAAGGARPDGGYMVIFGTGKYIEMGDANTTEGHSVLWCIWDNLGTSADSDHGVTRAKLYAQLPRRDQPATGAATFHSAGHWQYRGWRLDLPLTGERGDGPDTRLGYTAVNFVPPADCAASGTGAMMTFDNLYGTSRSARDHRPRPLGKPRIVALDMSAADAATYTARTATGRRDLTIHSRPVSGVGGVGAQDSSLAQGPMVSIPAGRRRRDQEF
jgi:type IV pilus assembly protein PilY1